MQLSDIRTEILAHGFDPTTFSTNRLNQYINDGQNLICRRINYYVDEASYSWPTTAGTASYPFTSGATGPQNFARARSLFNTDMNIELEPCSLRDIDRSAVAQGTPMYYALDGSNLHLYPTPDGVHNLELRYWKLPGTLALDTDTPTIPTDWHHLLWVYACWICYEAEDDSNMGQYWQQRFNMELAEFAADQKFPNTDFPTQARSMWEQDKELTANGWSLYWGY